jgi:hypothetical protein
MTGFRGPDIDAGAQTFLQEPIGHFRDTFISELTSRGSPHFRLAQVCYTGPRRELALEKEIAGRMMGQGKSHSECQKKQMPLETPSVNLQQEGVQSAKKTSRPCYSRQAIVGILQCP